MWRLQAERLHYLGLSPEPLAKALLLPGCLPQDLAILPTRLAQALALTDKVKAMAQVRARPSYCHS